MNIMLDILVFTSWFYLLLKGYINSCLINRVIFVVMVSYLGWWVYWFYLHQNSSPGEFSLKGKCNEMFLHCAFSEFCRTLVLEGIKSSNKSRIYRWNNLGIEMLAYCWVEASGRLTVVYWSWKLQNAHCRGIFGSLTSSASLISRTLRCADVRLQNRVEPTRLASVFLAYPSILYWGRNELTKSEGPGMSGSQLNIQCSLVNISNTDGSIKRR